MNICILSDDKKFSRMLELELKGLGASVVNEHTPPTLERENSLVLADLDYVKYEDLKALAGECEIYGWSKNPEAQGIPAYQLCSCFFERPFLMSELRQALRKYIDPAGAIKDNFAPERVRESGKRKNMLSCNAKTKEAVYGSKVIPLSDTEAKVLKLLCERRGEIVSREDLNSLFDGVKSNICDVYVCHLRKKLDEALGVKFIYTVKGKGYTLK